MKRSELIKELMSFGNKGDEPEILISLDQNIEEERLVFEDSCPVMKTNMFNYKGAGGFLVESSVDKSNKLLELSVKFETINKRIIS